MIETLSNPHVFVAKDHGDLCKEVVGRILTLSEEVITKRGRFALVLSGGSTPKGIYTLMANPVYRDRFQWDKIHLFWGDERWVSPEDPKSNYRMVAEALLTKIDIPVENVHPIRIKEGTPEMAAFAYEKELNSFFKPRKAEVPNFDLILLGIGRDGHTASLFPGSPAVTDRLVMPISHQEVEMSRITLTLPVINGARSVFFLASGREKAAIVQRVLENEGEVSLPAQKVGAFHKNVWWFLDLAAASLLTPRKGVRVRL